MKLGRDWVCRGGSGRNLGGVGHEYDENTYIWKLEKGLSVKSTGSSSRRPELDSHDPDSQSQRIEHPLLLSAGTASM